MYYSPIPSIQRGHGKRWASTYNKYESTFPIVQNTTNLANIGANAGAAEMAEEIQIAILVKTVKMA